MTRLSFLVITIAVSAAIALAIDSPGQPDTSEVGRYQIATSFEKVIVMDTQTAHVWSKLTDQQWQDEGSPLESDDEQAEAQEKPLRLEFDESIQLTIHQRGKKAIPNTKGRVYLSIDDITDGQVLISVSADSKRILDEVSLTHGEVATVEVDDTTLYIRLSELRNVLIGEDFATFEIATQPFSDRSARDE